MKDKVKQLSLETKDVTLLELIIDLCKKHTSFIKLNRPDLYSKFVEESKNEM